MITSGFWASADFTRLRPSVRISRTWNSGSRSDLAGVRQQPVIVCNQKSRCRFTFHSLRFCPGEDLRNLDIPSVAALPWQLTGKSCTPGQVLMTAV